MNAALRVESLKLTRSLVGVIATLAIVLGMLRDGVLKAHGAIPPPRPDGGCPLLDVSGKHCTVYECRPLV